MSNYGKCNYHKRIIIAYCTTIYLCDAKFTILCIDFEVQETQDIVYQVAAYILVPVDCPLNQTYVKILIHFNSRSMQPML